MFGSKISAFQKQLENHQRLTDRMSMTESPVSLAIKEMERNHLLNDVSKASSLAASIVNPINELINEQKNWNTKFNYVMSPVWEQMELFKQFHEHSAKLADFISPSISDYIQNNVRTNYEDNVPISVVEASYLETFEQLENDIDIDIETLDEISKEIEHNPELREDLRLLGKKFRKSFLSNEFTETLGEIINRRLDIKNRNVIPIIIAIFFILMWVWSTVDGKSD
jgi:hypothetical protein